MIGRKIRTGILLWLMLAGIHCATKSAIELPRDILGISIGSRKPDAQKRLEEIAEFEREERKQQQIWRLKNDSHYSHIIVGYDKDEKVRYLTVFADKSKERVRYSDIGDLSKAKKEITEPHHRYTWETEEIGGKTGFVVVAYGTEPEFLTSYSITGKFAPEQEEDE